MKALIFGAVVILVAVLTVLPTGLGWHDDVLTFLRGSLPVVAVIIGIILFFAGISDIRERFNSKKDKASEQKEGGSS